MIQPPFLKKGDKISIVSTARKITEDDIRQGVNTLKDWGLVVSYGKNLFNELNQFAGTDTDRAEDFQVALDDPSVKAIHFGRGGYGSVRIIDAIDWTGFRKNPKWLIGFSDVTVVHSHVTRNCGIETLHAPMPFNFIKITNESKERLRDVLFGKTIQYDLSEGILSDTNREGEAEGELTGGNLSILYSLLHSVSDADTAGKILFIEDVDEYLYHIDRMMIALKRGGKLSALAGLIVGGMTDMKDNKVRFNKTAEEIISEAVAEFNYPVLYGFPGGHIRNNLPLIFGKRARLTVGLDSTLKFL